MYLKTVLLIGCLLAIPLVLVISAFVQNDLPWQGPPGPLARLVHYLNNNDIKTEQDSVYPELRTHHYMQSENVLFDEIKRIARDLGWEIIEADRKLLSLHARVVSKLWKFTDDVYVSIDVDEESGNAVNIRSKSRIGKGDLGTNTKHIRDLYSALDQYILDKQKAKHQ